MLQSLLNIKPIDEEFINNLLDDIDRLKLNDDLPTLNDIIYELYNSDNDNEDLSSVIIVKLMNIIMDKFITDFNDYITSHNFPIKDISYHIYFDYMNSHYVLELDGNKHWVDDIVLKYICSETEDEKEQYFIELMSQSAMNTNTK